MNVDPVILMNLYAVASGQMAHRYVESCPDVTNGLDARDHNCPACRALIAAEATPGFVWKSLNGEVCS
ncbi:MULTISPECIES: hypothetical protein [Pseudomonas syringae group genomosp. 2]|uniref:Uncharacterized protein n=2 Tax=Pseudomonas amygdali pv. lachrymans TaxID=53707 RepID=A0ABR5KUF7_PSEAV|nr:MULTISPECIES: hypothetical protein [Pseudomonas syringae group genomosp. 2]AXH59815.1 hypothetical protein PLA107_031825 [Pseudomonas amygdali pv. lachrymans str. M301315]KPC17233.1 Uncharacterized protein AC499_0435 [Pseudomonas amygdali pv. lachrymans]KPC18192.1 Uncharacterized protein AC499_1394 [Pseudomonas amygdali pv. lachrymans]RMT05691.1 hypothetical protein ALP54_03699 [Pseudomonas amygdali pv. lachrymans]RMV32261.1 hypothetical protein ALP12_200225 [Pseudomonas savastanoi pv. phas